MRKITILIAVLATVLLLVTVVAPAIILAVLCDRHVSYGKVYPAGDFSLNEPEDMFLTTDDGVKINVKLSVPVNGEAHSVMVIVSGIDGPSVTSFYGYTRLFNDMGYACFLPELRAHGESGGKRICLAYKETADVEAVINEAGKRFPGRPVVLMGLSMGAGTILRVIGEDSRVCAAISFSAFSSVEDFVYAHACRFMPCCLAQLMRRPISLICSLKYGVDAQTATPIHGTGLLDGRSVLLVHSSEDSVVPFLCFEKLKAAAQKSTDKLWCHVIEGDHHLITTDPYHPEADAELWKIIVGFLNAAKSADSQSGPDCINPVK